MSLQKGDFVEIEFTGKLKDGGIFDSNIKEDLEKAGLKGHPKPFVFCIGEGMFIKGVDEGLVGKDVGKHTIGVSPEKGFGKRDPKLIQMVPLKNFIEHKLNPIPGSVFNFDEKLAKVLTVTGGRVMVDFNSPLAGKDLTYEINVLRKVDDIKEKIEALNDFFFREDLDFEVKGDELKLKVKKEFVPYAQAFKEKYEKMLGLKVEIVESSGDTKNAQSGQ